MKPYLNLGGNSGITAYKIDSNSITIQFKDGWFYLYDDKSSGADHIFEMQRLAQAGRGLNTYINQKVRSQFARKWIE